jgi:hypothetical protein
MRFTAAAVAMARGRGRQKLRKGGSFLVEVGVQTPSPAAKIFRSEQVPTRRVASLPEDTHPLHLHRQLRARRRLTVFWVCDAIATSAAITQHIRNASAYSITFAGAPE